MTETVRLRVRAGPRDLARFPPEDDALGERLFATLGDALAQGRPRPAILAIFEDRVDQLDAVPILSSPRPRREHLLGAIAGQDEAEAVALVGVLQLTMARRGPPVPAAVCFIEWADNRWWTAWQLLHADLSPATDEPIVRRAVDGYPRPGGVGGWFSLSRRLGLRLRLTPVGPDPNTIH